MVRIRRKFWERPVYESVYRCKQCSRLQKNQKETGSSAPGFVCACPRCGTTKLKIRRRRDAVDPIVKTLGNRLKGALGATLYHCEFCRLQFYSFKPLAEPKTEASPQES